MLCLEPTQIQTAPRHLPVTDYPPPALSARTLAGKAEGERMRVVRRSIYEMRAAAVAKVPSELRIKSTVSSRPRLRELAPAARRS